MLALVPVLVLSLSEPLQAGTRDPSSEAVVPIPARSRAEPAQAQVNVWQLWPGALALGLGGNGLFAALFFLGVGNLCFAPACPAPDISRQAPLIALAVGALVVFLEGAVWLGVALHHNHPDDEAATHSP